jgi:hypothetical protein
MGLFEKVDKIPGMYTRRTRLSATLVDQFIESGLEAAKINLSLLPGEHKRMSVYTSVKMHLANNPKKKVQIRMSGGELYFEKVTDAEVTQVVEYDKIMKEVEGQIEKNPDDGKPEVQ